jgi:NADH-ubiquinone oxidoreductase chain 4
MFNRTALGGFFSKLIEKGFLDVNKREFLLLLVLVVFTVIFGIYLSLILSSLDLSMNSLLYSV